MRAPRAVHRSMDRRTISRSRTQRPGVTSAVDAESIPFRGTTRSRRWRRVSRGLYVPRVDSPTLAAELVAWRLILPPSAVFTCLTAAELRGWWLPATVEHPAFVAVPRSDAHPQRPGLLVTRHPRAIPAKEIDGLSVASAAETLLATARYLSVLDLVILGDSALRLKTCTVEELRKAATQRRRGAPLLRTVIPLLDGRSESPWESVLRVLHRTAGIDVEPQKEIYDDRGRFLARADLWLVGTRRIHEYDGEVHRDRAVHRNDLRRDRRLVETGWQRIGFTSSQLVYEGASILAGVDQLLGRRWDPRRLARWEALLDDSLLRPSGRARAARRWSVSPQRH
jgi:very-short-patch-repair endonuclease